MTSNEKPQDRGDLKAGDASTTGACGRGNNNVSYGRVPDTSPYGRGGTGTSNTGVNGPTPMELRVNGDPSGCLFIHLGFTTEAEHCCVLEKFITGPDTIRCLDNTQVDHLVSVSHNPVGVGGGVPVSELSEWNFNLIVYFIK